MNDMSIYDFAKAGMENYFLILKVHNEQERDREKNLKAYIKLKVLDSEGEHISLEKQDVLLEHVVASFKRCLQTEITLEKLSIFCEKMSTKQEESGTLYPQNCDKTF